MYYFHRLQVWETQYDQSICSTNWLHSKLKRRCIKNHRRMVRWAGLSDRKLSLNGKMSLNKISQLWNVRLVVLNQYLLIISVFLFSCKLLFRLVLMNQVRLALRVTFLCAVRMDQSQSMMTTGRIILWILLFVFRVQTPTKFNFMNVNNYILSIIKKCN